MPGRRRVLAAGAGLAAAALAIPRSAAAQRAVRVFSSTDRGVAQPLIEDFERRHPGLRVDYADLGSAELAQRFVASGGRAADVLWSSAMDLQIKLANDGHAARHASLHVASLPRWAIWKHEAYATTCDPVGIAYHRTLLNERDLPRTHAELAQLLRDAPQQFRGRVATYDVERAGLGYLLAAQDAMASRSAWDLVLALAACQARLHANSQDMLQEVAEGRVLAACNVLGSYAEALARRQPQVGIVYPSDYTLVASRVAFVARNAPNPEGARLWLDHLLSPEGQRILGDECGLYPVRVGAAAARGFESLQRRLGNSMRPIALGPGLLALRRRTAESVA